MSHQNIGRDSAPWLLRCALLSLAFALSSCGGGGAADEVSAELQTVDHQWRLASTTTTAAATAVAEPTAANVTMLTRLSEKRIDRTVFEYVFKVTVKNGTEPQTGVIASLTGAGAGTTIVDGTVDVGDLGPGDVLAVAGKGHEQGQTVAGTVLPFDDVSVVRGLV